MIIDRHDLKTKAKEVLKNNYWMSFAICIIVNAITNSLSLTFQLPVDTSEEFDISSLLTMLPVDSHILLKLGIAGIIAAIAVLILFGIAINAFVLNPVIASGKRYFIKSAIEETSFHTVLDIFKGKSYLNVVKTLFIRRLIIFLYSLFFIIPLGLCYAYIKMTNASGYILFISFFGLIPMIIKEYSYFMVDYIIADNPETPTHDTLQKSKEIMTNCRFETFKLELSFYGLLILGVMVCVVGVYFVLPYIEATLAQLYLDRKNKINPNNFYGDNYTNYGEY